MSCEWTIFSIHVRKTQFVILKHGRYLQPPSTDFLMLRAAVHHRLHTSLWYVNSRGLHIQAAWAIY